MRGRRHQGRPPHLDERTLRTSGAAWAQPRRPNGCEAPNRPQLDFGVDLGSTPQSTRRRPRPVPTRSRPRTDPISTPARRQIHPRDVLDDNGGSDKLHRANVRCHGSRLKHAPSARRFAANGFPDPAEGGPRRGAKSTELLRAYDGVVVVGRVGTLFGAGALGNHSSHPVSANSLPEKSSFGQQLPREKEADTPYAFVAEGILLCGRRLILKARASVEIDWNSLWDIGSLSQ